MTEALNTENALNGLEGIPWSKLLAVYGMAQGIPGAIRSLATSTSETVRNTAAKLLLNELEHQDSVTQATPFAVPFLVALLRVQQMLGDQLSVDKWVEVRGPDSMELR